MAYLAKKRRRLGQGDLTFSGDSVSGLPSLPTSTPGGFPDLLGIGESGVQDIENLLLNASSGNITANQVATIKAQGDASIAQAAAGDTDLTAAEQAQWHQELTDVVNSGYYGGSGNLLADLGIDNSPGAPSTANPTGILGWIEQNFLLIFGVAAAFLIFRPDKAFK